MKYPFVPMPQRGRLAWPGGKRVALLVTINLEYWDMTKPDPAPYYAGGPAILQDPLPGNVPDIPNYSWREYGQRVGVWRMMKLLDELAVRASCTMNAKMALERRPVIDAALVRGWELVAHNYEQGDLLTRYANKPDEERRVIEETLKVYRQVVGKPAKGWLSSSLRSTAATCEILADNGVLYYCDLMNDDQPYMIETPKGRIVCVPYSIEINDFTLFLRRNLSIEGAVEVMKENLDVLYAEAADTGLLMNVGLHPHIIGVPHRIRALREFLAYAKSLDGVWWPTREEIAAFYLANHASHIKPA